MDRLKKSASDAVAAGYTIVILSDRGADRDQAPIPSLLATAGVHHHLVRQGTRTQCGLVVESGDAREVHHCALLLGYGAGVVNPYLAFETLDDMIRQRQLVGVTHDEAVINYIHALNKGILKVMSKMGISTLQGYCGAQIFEAVGLDRAFIDRYFTWTASRIGGVGIDVCRRRKCSGVTRTPFHRGAAARGISTTAASTSGAATASTTSSTRTRSSSCSTRPAAASTRSSRNTRGSSTIRARRQATLRGLLELASDGPAIPIDEVEPVERIVKRFATGAMSYGSISQEAHETPGDRDEPASAASRTPAKAARIRRARRATRTATGGAARSSRWRRRASASPANTSSTPRISQIKMAQGAKPGEGGQLPGHKVYPWIAEGPLRDARRRADLAAAASRHLLDRGSRRADLRPEEREPAGADLGEARRRLRASARSRPASRRRTPT